MERMLEWDETRHILKADTRENMISILNGERDMSYKMKWGFYYELIKLIDHGFKK
jgi:hypothetical protein